MPAAVLRATATLLPALPRSQGLFPSGKPQPHADSSQHRAALLESRRLWGFCRWCWTAGSCNLELQRHGWGLAVRQLGVESTAGLLAGRLWPCEHPAEPCSLQSCGRMSRVLRSAHRCQLFRFRLLMNCRPINNSSECLLSVCCREDKCIIYR